MFNYEAFTKAVVNANKELYEYINTHLSSLDFKSSQTIGYGGDKSLNIDLLAENIFIKHLQKFGDIYSEEVGLLSNNSKIKIVIDPLDGSNNFYSQLPYYGTSVALQIHGETHAGYVCNLINASLIYKVQNKKKTISILSNKQIKHFDIINPKIGIFERAYAYPKICKKLFENDIKYRSCGAVALSLANAQNYKFVIFAGKLREFDIAAALYISSNLFIHQDDEFLIIAKSEQNLLLIKEIIKNNRL